MLQSELLKYARDLMREHGLETWTLQTMHSKKTAGQCCASIKSIRLSVPLLVNGSASELDCRNVILHEIAHALTPGHKHDAVWRRKLLDIGGDGKQFHSINTSHRYVGSCSPGCDSKLHRDARSERMTRLICRKCRAKITWTDTQTGEVIPPQSAKTTSNVTLGAVKSMVILPVSTPATLCTKCFTIKSVSGDCLC